jgi:CRP-like cAMP-binding protein
MQFDAIFTPLTQAPLFSGLSAAHLKSIALTCERVNFADGDVLISTGSVGDAAFLIARGCVVRTHHPLGPMGHEEFGPGTLVGETAMLAETEHSSTVVARGPVVALLLSRDVLRHLIEQDPSLGDYFADRLMERVDDMIGGLKQISGLLRLDDAMSAEQVTDRLH